MMHINFEFNEKEGNIFSFFLILITICTSCGAIIGYKNVKVIDQSAISKFYNKLDCKDYDKLILDSTYLEKISDYFRDTLDFKNMIQPIRAHYFLSQNLSSSLINCYAPGVLKLDWNTENRFNTFPPKSHYTFKKPIYLSNMEDFLGVNIRADSNLVVLIFWSRIFERKSADFINLIYNNLIQQKIRFKIILINDDALFI